MLSWIRSTYLTFLDWKYSWLQVVKTKDIQFLLLLLMGLDEQCMLNLFICKFGTGVGVRLGTKVDIDDSNKHHKI